MLRAEPVRPVDIIRHLAKGKLSQNLQHQRWFETTELAAIMHVHFEIMPPEPMHPIDQIIALRSKYASCFDV